MNQKTKSHEKNEEKREECVSETSEKEENEKRSYYYDDAHGYEIYNPVEDEEES